MKVINKEYGIEVYVEHQPHDRIERMIRKLSDENADHILHDMGHAVADVNAAWKAHREAQAKLRAAIRTTLAKVEECWTQAEIQRAFDKSKEPARAGGPMLKG